MANTSSSRAAGASQGASVAASETGGTPPESGAAAEKIQVVTGQRTAAVVQ